MEKKSRKFFYLEYSLLFFLIAGTIVFYYYSQGKSMIDSYGDGFRQHFRSLVYYSNCLRETLNNFFNGSFIIPQWDFSLGEGSDVLGTFHYYGMGDIFTFFCFLCPEDHLYIYYDATTILRMFCAGVSFANICFYKQNKSIHGIVVGSLIYAFSAFCLTTMSGHVYFISAAVYLPLIILGVEKIINHDKPYLLSIAVMLSAISNIYFFYMNVISTVVFVVVRLLLIKEEWSNRFIYLLRITLYSSLGLLMGMIVFLPMLNLMLNNGRLKSGVTYNYLYSFEEYAYLFKTMTFDGAYFGGFSILWPIGFSALFVKKKNIVLITLLVIMVLFLGLPYLSSFYNAMLYPTERWCYASTLLICYIITDAIDDIDNVNKLFFVNVVFIVVYYSLCVVLDIASWRIHFLLMIMSLCLIILLKVINKKNIKHFIILMSVVIFMLFETFFIFGPYYVGYANYGQDIGDIKHRILGEYIILDSIDENSFFRYSGKSLVENASIHGKQSSTQYYWSIVNSNITDFRKQLAYYDRSVHHINNYGERFAQNMLSSVKYYVNTSKGDLPFGYEFLSDAIGIEIYKTNYSLPLLYAYDNYMLLDEWKDYNPAEKNEILVQSVVINKNMEGIRKRHITLYNKEIDYKQSLNSGIIVTQSQIKVINETGNIYLDVNNNTAGEYYVMIEGLNSNKLSESISIQYDDIVKNFIFKGTDNQHYTDRHDYLINLGYLEGVDGRISIVFSNTGTFEYESIKVICQPLDYQIECIERLRNINIKDLDVKNNKITSTVSIDDNKIVCFSIPYSKGWKAFVDGKKVELLNCNIQYMGIELEKGNHTIELKYSTPLLKEGAIISFVSSALFIYLVARNKKSNKW